MHVLTLFDEFAQRFFLGLGGRGERKEGEGEDQGSKAAYGETVLDIRRQQGGKKKRGPLEEKSFHLHPLSNQETYKKN